MNRSEAQKMKKNKTALQKVAILIEDQYQVLEVWYPCLRLKEEKIMPVFVGTGKEIYQSKEGYPAKAEISVQKVKAQDFSGVIIPGGYAPDLLRRYKEAVDFVKAMHEANKLVAAICHGGWLLASAEILQGKNVTGFFAIKDDLIHAGARYQNKEVVVDGHLITSRKPEDLPGFCGEIIRFLKKDAFLK